LTRETASTALKQEIELQIRPQKMKLQEGDFERIQEGWQQLGQSIGLDLERYRQSEREREGPIPEAGPGGEAPTALDPHAQAILDR
ncbi:hypothetical protein, partial [Chromobacterium amazonense]|uniref:hypothetical protein n=1 Tax=Chromobacterium amazonense TaxID=1382803 RepID=UPI003F7ADF1B